MIGKTNIPMGMSKGETVSILLTTNQATHDDLNGVKVVVSYDEESHEYTYNGQFSVEIPKEKTYTVAFGEVDGYKTPSSVTYTAVKGFSRSIEAIYYSEFVTVNVSTEDGADVDGQAVIVETRVPSEGVYIEDTSYKLWTADEWDNSATANSIVVSDGSMARRVSLTNSPRGKLGYFQYNSTLPAIGTQEEAELDMNGKENTSLLKEEYMSAVSETDRPYYDIYYAPYSFPDGSKRGYVPSLGELIFLYKYHSEINSALEKCGAEAIIHSFGATSVQYRMYSSTVRTNSTASQSVTMWTIDWDNGYIYYHYSTISPSTGGIMVRPIADYDTSYPITNGKASFSVPYDETYTVSVDDMDGYTTPESQTYTASQPTREISMEYKKAGEHLVVNVSSDDNAVSGYEINIFKPEYIGANNEYLKLDYIESTGEQYILLHENGDTDYILDIQFTSSKGRYTGIYMSGSHMAVGTNNQLELYFGDKFTTYDYPLTDRMTVKFDCNNQIAYIDDVEVITSAGYERAGVNMGLFALSRNGVIQSSSDYAYMKLYSFVIKYNDGLISDYIPVMRISDGIVGLYDRINEEFFSSETGVNFKAGFGEYVIGTQTSATGEYDIPLGTEYMITASDVSGYTTPASQTFTAEAGTRTVNMVYEAVKLGVFIQGVSGKLYETDAWSSQETPNGVAVITENCSFVIALENAHTAYCQWGSYSTIVSGITTTTTESEAKTDYDGEAQTTTILNELGNTSSTYDAPAAYYCRAYTFPNGKEGYLGALGEWQAVLDNKEAVESALSKCDGTTFNRYYWTSTQYSYLNSWYMYLSNEYVTYSGKNKNYYVRAFAAI